MNKRRRPAIGNRCSVSGEDASIRCFVCEICWLLATLIPSSLGAFVLCFSTNWHLLYLSGCLSCLVSVHQFEVDWNGFVWNKVPITTLSLSPVGGDRTQRRETFCPALVTSPLSQCRSCFPDVSHQTFGRFCNSGQNTDATSWNPGLPPSVSGTQKNFLNL